MFKMLKYLKKYAGFIAAIVVLLFLQAYCDLSLPGLTSNIVNVGIQQGGIEDAVPDRIREGELNKLLLFMDEGQKADVSSSYTLEDGIYHLNKVGSARRVSLEADFAKPMAALVTLGSNKEAADAMREQWNLPADASITDVLLTLPQEQLEAVKAAVNEKLSGMQPSILSQSAIEYIKGEYQAQGQDLGGLQQKYILLSGLKMLALALLIMVAAISVTFLSCRVAASLSRDLRERVYQKVLSFSSAEFNQFSTASLITRSTNDIQQVQMLMTMVFRIVLYAPIMGIGGVMKVLGTNTSMAWIIGLAVTLIIAVVSILFSVAMPRFKKLQELIDNLNLVTREILTGIPVIRAFSTQKHEEERFEDANRKLMKTNLFVNRCMTFMMPAMTLIMNGITVLIVYRGAFNIDSGAMQVGDLMAFIQYTMQIIMSFLMLTMMSIMLPRASVSATRINQVLETEVSLKDPESEAKAEPSKKGQVEFKHVTFAYPGAGENVLTDLNFTCEKGKTTAIIGSTGSGKSTLVNLIPRFFDVTEGQLLVDGVDVREMNQHKLHDRIGYVPQKGVLFSGTIDSNLRYGCEDAPESDIYNAARIAQALDFIEEKPEKFDSAIAQGGSNVSGGQKQRLSIARAIAKKPDIYIFDDSFSALDYKTEVALRRELQRETKDATTIIVAQRISTILHADQILVLDEGRIAGMGTHRELMNSCEVYRQIAMSQLSKEELDNE